LPVAFYVCETWSVTLRVKTGPWVLENRALRTFGPGREAVIAG